jgi:hypothetical protein
VIGQIVKKRISHGDALNVDAMIDAYNVLHKGDFKSAEEIRRSFFRKGQPLLTPKQADNVYRAIHGKQLGGRDSLINETAESVIDTLSGVQRGPPIPPGAAAAAEKAYKTFQLVLRIVLPWVFILDTVQHTPLFGELIGAALDITAATLPVIATMIQTSTPALVGLIPVPYAGTIGILLGWLFSAWFLWLAAVIALSRKDFAGALEATAGMIPVVGASAMKIVASVDRVTTKLANRAEKIMESISHAYGSAMGAIASVRSKIPASLPSVKDLKAKMPTVAELKANVPNAADFKASIPSVADLKEKAGTATATDENPKPPAAEPKAESKAEPAAAPATDNSKKESEKKKEEPKKSFAPAKTRKGKKGGRRTRRRR